jgi:predicted Zn-dependent peptidase
MVAMLRRTLRPLGLALPLLLIGPTPSGAAKPDESAESDIAIEFERYTLDNGLEVILHRDPSAPLVAVNIWYHVGSGDEVPGKSGFAHLFEHMMFQGAKHIGEDVHFDILREIGATEVNGTTNSDRTNYYETVPANELETALWLESDRMGYMLELLNEKSLANQIDVVRNERRQRYDNVAYGLERFALAKALYPEGHPYRYLTIGKHEDLESASVDDVKAFFQKWYVPSNATLLLAGDFEPAAAKAMIDKWFGSFPKLPKPSHIEVAPPKLERTHREVIEDPFARLRRIHWAWHGPKLLSDDDYALTAAADVLGAEGWGRLHRRLVEQDKLAHSVNVRYSASMHSGTFDIVVTLLPGSDDATQKQVEGIMQDEVDRLLEEGPSEAELARHVIGVESGFVWSLEELGSRANQLQFFNHVVGQPDFAGKYLERLHALTPAAIETAVNTHLVAPRVELISVPAATPAQEGAAK